MTNSTLKDVGKYEALLDYMFLDEGHRIKNRNTETEKSLSRLICLHGIIITATPLQNNLMELWALFQFCVPGLLGSENEFVNKYGCIHEIVEENTSIKEQRSGYSAVKKIHSSILFKTNDI
ncbi:protein CHROMATIN REMODELING 24-like isoform X2 [Primulina huaijiensis]|uniref:protein CHROMATIN REMODELING 24-like isoform X2 n=1 Tax=Primulina huaijiensis TaxID=1492673 RepID=UPI003CC7727D